MGRVLTNNVSLAYAIQQAQGTLGGSPTWRLLEPNTINSYGANTTTVTREPISKNRQREKGSIVDLDSNVEWAGDLTLSHFQDFAEGFVFSTFQGPAEFTPSAVTSGGTGGYTVASGGDLTQNTLVYARGFTNAGNNGLKVVAASATATNIRVDGLTAEASPPSNAVVTVCGFRGASGDLQINASGNLISTVLDFTTLPINVGSFIRVGGEATANQFANAENNAFARVTAISANEVTLDKKAAAFTTDTGTGKTIDIYFGRFLRNVAVDDGDFVERYFQFELSYPNLESGGGTSYEYSVDNLCNSLQFQLPLTDKATITVGLIGTNTEDITATQKTNADSPILPNKTASFNTSADIARLRITDTDETGLTTDFKSINLTINNNVSPEKVLAQLGAKFLNTGIFAVDIEAQLVFTNKEVVNRIKNNTTVTMDFILKSDDGAIAVDIPSLDLGGGGREFPVNQSVLLNTTGQAFRDDTLGYSIGMTHFAFVPSS